MKAAVCLAALLGVLTSPAVHAAGPDHATMAARAAQIFKTCCHRCHGNEGTDEGGFNYILDRRQLVGRKKIIPGDAARSRIYKRLRNEDNPMPPDDEKPRPTPEDIALIKQWIDAGAPDFHQAQPQRPFITPADVHRRMARDLRRLKERDRRFTRYFTLTHLVNAGLAADQIQSYRHGLAKLVNSLSWGSQVMVPRPIDPGKTIFRIDLRDYQWNEKIWETIVAANPYGILANTPEAKFCTAATHCKLAFVRADWFVAAASRPPLYHEVLQLPVSDSALEKMLRVDVAENIRQERVARAGFNSSGVSRNNRLIERHESGGVVYWKSYDFAGNTGRRNLFAHPLGPDTATSAFQHDGGEIIFSLPNGLQAYLLVDGQGKRIDKGPIRIVSDPRRPDRAVENGLSCMSCHARGMIEKNDQVRDHVQKNARAFADKDVQTVRALYPARGQLLALLRKDARRFQEAVARTGAPWSKTEPIVALALRFEGELDLSLASAEAGVLSRELLKMLDRSPHLAKHLGPLRVEGGTVQRQVFVDVFPELVRALKAGTFLEPRLTAFAGWIKRGNDRLRGGDPAGAIQAFTEAVKLDPASAFAFHKRAAAHHDRGTLDKAIADYTRAIRLAPEDAVAYNNRGLAFYDRNSLNRAIADFDKALDLDPRYAVAHYNRGLASKRKGDTDTALADFNAALRLDRHYALAYQSRAAIHYGRGDYDEAIADYDQVLRLRPGSAVAYNNRGFAYYDRGDYDKAITDFSTAIRLHPKNAIAYYNRGLVHHDKKAYDKAIADFSAAIRLNAKFARAYLGRSHSLAKQGATDRADRDRAVALRLDPSVEDE